MADEPKHVILKVILIFKYRFLIEKKNNLSKNKVSFKKSQYFTREMIVTENVKKSLT